MGQRQSRSRETYMRKIDFIFYREKRNTRGSVSSAIEYDGRRHVKIDKYDRHSSPNCNASHMNLTPLKSVTLSGGKK